MNIPTEIFEKAKKAESTQDIVNLAKDSGIELDSEEADAYFDLLHGSAGELADDELNNVSGGLCHKNGHAVVTHFNSCDSWKCKHCGESPSYEMHCYTDHTCNSGKNLFTNCTNCAHCKKKKGLWLCYLGW